MDTQEAHLISVSYKIGDRSKYHTCDTVRALDWALEQIDELTTTLHDVFELATRQKSFRKSSTQEGLITTTKAGVRIIRDALDAHKAKLQAHQQALKEAREMLLDAGYGTALGKDKHAKLIRRINSVLGSKGDESTRPPNSPPRTLPSES